MVTVATTHREWTRGLAGHGRMPYPRAAEGPGRPDQVAENVIASIANRIGSSPEADADEGVLSRLADRESGAMEACLDRFGGLVWSLVRRLGANLGGDAEDAVQEIFLDIWKNAYRYDSGIASETAFVAMIARRRLIDRQRKRSRRPTEQGLIDEAGPSQAAEGQDRIELADEAGKAARALTDLSQEQQRVLKLAIYHGLSHEKISRATGLPLGTVKTHARRGLLKVRDLLSQNEEQGRDAGTGGGA